MDWVKKTDDGPHYPDIEVDDGIVDRKTTFSWSGFPKGLGVSYDLTSTPGRESQIFSGLRKDEREVSSGGVEFTEIGSRIDSSSLDRVCQTDPYTRLFTKGRKVYYTRIKS